MSKAPICIIGARASGLMAALESRLHRGLFFCGEVLDAFGPIGGHNFQWAWATGRAAGLGAAGGAVPP